MKKNLLLTAAFLLCLLPNLLSQDVFNPSATQPVDNFTGTLPSYGAPFTFKKWIRTPSTILPNPFNTEKFKAYFYRASGNAYDTGMAFRLRYPNNYNPNNATKYPVILFMHGIGEAGPLKDNETNLSWGAKEFEAKIDSGLFNAFLLFPQTVYGDWEFNFSNINAVLDGLQLYCNTDPDRIITMGLSLGGDGTMKYSFLFPQRSAVSIAASPGSIGDFTQNPTPFIHIPFWVASGAFDDQFSSPARVGAFIDQFTNNGGDARWTLYPNRGHGTWPVMWDEPYLVPYWQKAHKANPLVFNKQTDFPANTPFTVKIGITQGFAQYQWQRNGVDLANTTNEITVSQPGTYRVRFKRTAGGSFSDWSPNPAVITQPAGADVTPPSTPANLQVTSTTTTSVSLNWDNSTDNVGVTGYDIFVNGAFKTATTSSDGVATGLNPSTTYSFTVRARDQANNNSAFSSAVNGTTATPPDVTPPSTPGNLQVVSVTTSSVSLDWDNSTDNIGVTGYDIFVNGAFKTATTSSDGVATGLNPSTTYSFTVRARDQANNNSAFSSAVNGTTATPPDVTPPSTPGNLQVVSVTTSSVSLNWDNSTDNIGVTGYDIFVNGVFKTATTNSDGVATGLNPSTTYSFTVRARDLANNNSAFSSAVNGTTATPPDVTPPSTPGNLQVVSVTTSSVALDWDNSIDNIGVTGYDIFVNGTFKTSTTSSDGVATGLNPSTTYSFTVRARDQANNNSSFSQAVNGTTATPPDLTPPSVPANLLVVSSSTNSVALDWDNSIDNVGVTGYDIFVNGIYKTSTTSSDGVASGLNPATTYSFTVRAHDLANNNSGFSNSVNGTTGTVPDVTPPTTPANLIVVSASTNSVTLDWDNSTDNIGVTGYDIFVNGAFKTSITNSDGVATGLNPSTTYSFTVRAHDLANNNSGFSNSVNGTTGTPPDVTPPTTPANLVVVSTSTNSVSLNWDNSTDNVGVTGYDIFVNGSFNTSTINSDGVVTGLNPSTTYSFVVRARDAANNNSGFSNSVNGTTGTAPDVTPPTAPANLVVVSTSTNSVSLNWDNSTDNVGVTGYDVFVNGSFNTSTINSDGVVTGLNPNTTYSFVVRARDGANNNSGFSNSVNGTTGTAPDVTPPTTPANLVVVSTSTNSVSLNWDNSTDNVGVTGYDVFVNGSFNTSTVNSDGVVSGLNPNTTYSFVVRARDGANNNSGFSNSVNGTTGTAADVTPPTAPANLVVVSSGTNSVSLNWDNSTDNVGVTGYEIFVNGLFNASTTVSDGVVSGLSPATTYSFTVRARDLANNISTFSASVNGTTAGGGSGALSYKFYQGSFTVLPNFAALTPVMTGTSPNVDISVRTAGVNDNFAFLWEGYIILPSTGTYTFETVSDDGSKLYFNTTYSAGANALVNNDGLHAPTSATGSVTIAAGTYPIAISFFEATGGEGMQVYWSGPGIARQLVPSSAFTDTGTPPSGTAGLSYKYYEGAFTILPNFNALTPVKTGTSSIPDITARNAGVNDNFAFLWEGFITLPAAGQYTFETVSDDGSKLYFNTIYSPGAAALVSNDGLHAANSASGTTGSMAAGTYPIAISFFEATGGETMQVYWSGPGITRQLIPASAFSTSGTPPATTNGLNYKYYQGAFTVLPNFSALTPVKTGTSPNTDISVRTAGVNDNFAFLWEGFITLPAAGSYTFETVSDDGSRLYFNTTYSAGASPLVNNDGLHAPASASGTTGSMAAGTYPIAISFFEATGGETIAVYWTGPGMPRQLIPNSAFTTSGTTPPPSTAGLNYKYYEGSFTVLPNFNALTPAKTGNSANADISVRNTGVNDNFAFIWEGFIQIPTAGTYTFETVSDDGSKLYFNTAYSPGATALVSNDGLHAPTSATGSVNIAAGTYPIAITFFEATGGEGIQVYWTGPGITRQLIPNSAFTRTNSGVEEIIMSANVNSLALTVDAYGKTEIKQIFPNPFSESFSINFFIATTAKISVDVTDVSGKLVFKQDFGSLSAGNTTLKINAGKQAVVPGTYFVRMMVNGLPVKVMKMLRK